MKRSRFYIYTDASIRDGLSAWAFVSVTPGLAPDSFIYHAHQSGMIPVKCVKGHIELAELYAIWQALKWVLPVSKVHVFTDSERSAFLLTQRYAPNDQDKALYQELTRLCKHKQLALHVHKIKRASCAFSEYVNLLCRYKVTGEQTLPFWLFERSYKNRNVDWAIKEEETSPDPIICKPLHLKR